MTNIEEIRSLFPQKYRYILDSLGDGIKKLQEIRIRVGSPIRLLAGNQEYVPVRVITQSDDVEEFLKYLCEYSLFAFAEELRQGFFTIKGGHRIGVAGVAVQGENRQIRHMRDIRFINIRIAHEIPGVSDSLVRKLVNGDRVYSTLIIAPPCCGKTTFLRDIIRNLSDGFGHFTGKNVAVIDERCEIAGEYMGVPQNYVGARTDVMSTCPKSIGIMMLLRAMSPGIIAVDEIGGREDANALLQANYSGCKIIASAHGITPSETMTKENFRDLEREHLFERFVVLARDKTICYVSGVYDEKYELC